MINSFTRSTAGIRHQSRQRSGDHTRDVRGPAEYGFTDRVVAHFTDHPVDGGQVPARVVRVDRNRIRVATADGLMGVPYPPGPPLPASGDWVWLGPNHAHEPGFVAVLPRTSELSRKRAFEDSSEAQVLAANIDVVGVVVPVDRPLTHNRLERTLVAAWDSGAVPLVTTLINALAGWKVHSTGAVRAVD